MLSIYRLFLVFLMIIPFTVEAQYSGLTTDNKKAIKFYEEARTFSRRGQFPEAINALLSAIKKDDQFAEAYLALAGQYLDLGDKQKAVQVYIQLKGINPSYANRKEVDYRIAKAYYNLGEYQLAREYLDVYMEKFNYSKNTNPTSILARRIDFSIEAVNNPVELTLTKLQYPINGFQYQYFPVLTVDKKFMFITVRKGSGFFSDEDIYVAKKGDDGYWYKPFEISPIINTKQNEGTCSISADGRILIFTSCQGRQSYGSCDLYITTREGNKWTLPKNLGSNINSRQWDSQPSLSADGRTLYFVSTRPGGFGRRDIWVAKKNKEDYWQEPQNMGKVINTATDDIAPFIHVNGQTLYFSSDGLPGLGGFDFFYSERQEDGWSKPKNLGYPLNDKEDQVSLFITADGKTAYYTQDTKKRDRVIKSDIYTFPVPEENRVTHWSNFLTGTVYDAETNQKLRAKIDMYDINTNELISSIYSDSVSGKYFVVLTEGNEYGIYATKKGYIFEDLRFNYIKKPRLVPEVLDIYLTPVNKGVSTVLENIFFDFDKYKLKEKSKSELYEIIEFLNQNPEVQILITGHTDNEGDNKYNMELSNKRANAVYKFLLENGINPQRLSFKGYGKDKPLVPNDSEYNRSLNRRIEFEIL
ncbi:MAG TPA: OmpA family protein [Cyclobacteriaceae bacterium]